MIKGRVSDIQRFSLHDGAGIRTTVFLSGCPLRCIWCHNPEAMHMTGRDMDVEEIVHIALLDKPYYDASGGGVTLSGGEPTVQWEFAREILRRLKAECVHTAIETSLSAGYASIEALLPYLDVLYCDIKLLDEEAHRKYTGKSNADILENLVRVAATGKNITIHTPLIPGITDSDDNIRGIAQWIQANIPNAGYELLNYNPLAEAKWQDLGKAYLPGKCSMLSKERLDALYDVIHQVRQDA